MPKPPPTDQEIGERTAQWLVRTFPSLSWQRLFAGLTEARLALDLMWRPPNAHSREGHKTVRVSVDVMKSPIRIAQQGEIDIDVKLTRLMPLVWANGITTEQSCQEYRPGEAWITFPSTEEAMKFLDIAQQSYKVEVETWDEGENGRLAIAANLQVLFLTKDIPRLVKAFRKANESSKKPGKRRAKGV